MSSSIMREWPQAVVAGMGEFVDADRSGVMLSPKEQVTAQQYDLQFGTNVIGMLPVAVGLVVVQYLPTDCRCVGPYVFTRSLLPALFAATDASPSHEKARIVTVSSSANYFSKGVDFDAIADGPGRKKCNDWELYVNSKFVHRIENLPNILVLLT